MPLYRLFILVCLLLCAVLRAQDPHPAFRQYTVDDGLPSFEVYQVKQDSKGYIWFATNNGVSRYDGYTFENFSIAEGLPDNTVFEIYEDPNGKIWFVPLSCRLSYYDKGRIHVYPYNDSLLKVLKNPVKTSFAVDKKGRVYLGVDNHGIYEISDKGEMTVHHRVHPFQDAMYLTEPLKGEFIYSINHIIETTNNSYVDIDIVGLKTRFKVEGNLEDIRATTRVVRLSNGKLLFSCYNRVIIVSPDGSHKMVPFNGRVHWMYEDKSHGLWIATYMDGLYYLENGDFNNMKRYLPDVGFNGFMQDKEGGFWAVSETNSVYYFASKRVLTYDMASGLSFNKVNCLEYACNKLYVGLQNGYLNRVSEDGRIEIFRLGTQNGFINSIFYLKYHKKLDAVLTHSGLTIGIIKTHGTQLKAFKARTHAFDVLENEDGSYWGCNNSSTYYARNNFPYDSAWSVYKKRSSALLRYHQNILIGGAEGLVEFNPVTKAFFYHGDKHPLLKNRITSMAYTLDSNWLVLGTKGTGLLLYNHDAVIQISPRTGFSSENVKCLWIDANYIWAATPKGLDRINILQNKPIRYTIRHYTTSDGLASNEVNDLYGDNKRLWIATDKGLSLLPLDTLEEPFYNLPVYIKRIGINDKDTALTSSYELAHDQNNIRIDFIGLSYKSPGLLNYRYKMVGLDTNWVYTQNRDVQFTTLPANRYTFLLSVQNLDGSWSHNVAKVNFHIHAPFWKLWWFLLLTGAAGLYIVFIVIRYRFRRARREEEKEEMLNKSLLHLKQKALRAQMNPHFTFNVMNSIQHFILHNRPESAHRYLSKFSKLMRIILNNSESNTIPIADEIKALELYLELEAMRFEREFQYEVELDPLIDAAETPMPSMLIQPYVENAIKHGILPAGRPGMIRIRIFLERDYLKCTIEDNGIGRVQAEKEKNKHREAFEHRSFGTYITKERLSVLNELYNSDLSENIVDLYDAEGHACGTLVEIFIPHIPK